MKGVNIVKERTRRAYDRVGSDYDNWYWFKKAKELRTGLTEQVIGILKTELRAENRKQPKLLDLCCGTGHLAGSLCGMGDYTGLDFAPGMISACMEKYPKKRFVLGDAESLPFKDKSFDCVVCFWSFHHIVYPEMVLDEIKRVLKPNGLLVIATFKDVGLNFAAKLGDMVSGAYWGYTTKRYSKKDMGKLMGERFKSVNVEIYPKSLSLLNAMGVRFLIASGRN
jgi:ubiquinone/menaquinone biosynthesis C-methylase UbiE